MSFEQQISISSSLNDHVTLKTGVACWKFSFAITGIKCIFKYIKSRKQYKILPFYYIFKLI